MSNRYHYLRSSYRSPKSEPIGCFLTSVDPDKSKVSYIVSIAHPRDKFNKIVARKIVDERHNLGYNITLNGDFSNSHTIVKSVMNDIVSRKMEGSQTRFHYPKRVRDAASKWLSFSNSSKCASTMCDKCGSCVSQEVKE